MRDAPNLRPPRPDFRQQARVAGADFFRRAAWLFEQFCEELLNAILARHFLLRRIHYPESGEKSGNRSARRSRPRLSRRDTVLTETPSKFATSVWLSS